METAFALSEVARAHSGSKHLLVSASRRPRVLRVRDDRHDKGEISGLISGRIRRFKRAQDYGCEQPAAWRAALIPPMTPSGVLPPFVSGFPNSGPASCAPYETSMTEIAARFCTSAQRVKLFKGLLQLRAELQALGVNIGVQWIDGSFCENVEAIRGRPPADIDVVTLLIRPQAVRDDAAWQAFWQANQRVFYSKTTKAVFGCEAFYIDAGYPALWVAEQVTYWFGLFTHQRVTHMWKGILQLPLVSDDAAAAAYVSTLQF
jgi:hypothetical protein